MILFLGHGPRPRTNPNAAGGVALGWVPLVYFCVLLTFLFCWNMLEHTSCVGIGGQDMMKTMAIINKINGLGPELFFLIFQKVSIMSFALCLPFFLWNTHLLGLDMFGFNI